MKENMMIDYVKEAEDRIDEILEMAGMDHLPEDVKLGKEVRNIIVAAFRYGAILEADRRFTSYEKIVDKYEKLTERYCNLVEENINGNK